LFAALEAELLQGDVTEQRVVDAYAAYLAGSELSGLPRRRRPR
jgi:hypothetical protein